MADKKAEWLARMTEMTGPGAAVKIYSARGGGPTFQVRCLLCDVSPTPVTQYWRVRSPRLIDAVREWTEHSRTASHQAAAAARPGG